MNEERQGRQMRTGLNVIFALAILTAIEFAVAVYLDIGVNVLLAIIAVIKAWLILDYFMHMLKNLGSSEDEH